MVVSLVVPQCFLRSLKVMTCRKDKTQLCMFGLSSSPPPLLYLNAAAVFCPWRSLLCRPVASRQNLFLNSRLLHWLTTYPKQIVIIALFLTASLGWLRFPKIQILDFTWKLFSLGANLYIYVSISYKMYSNVDILKTRLKVAYGDRLALRVLVSTMVWSRF